MMSIEDMTDDELFTPAEQAPAEAEPKAEGDAGTNPTDNAKDLPNTNAENSKTDELNDGAKADGEGNAKEGGEKSTEHSSRASDRIKQLVDERNRERETVAQLQAQLDQYKQQSPTSEPSVSPSGEPVEPSMDDFDLETEEGLNAFFEASEQYRQQSEQWQIEQQYQHFAQRQQAEQQEQQIQNDFKQAFESNPQFKADFANLQTWMQDKPVTADPSVLYQGQDLMDIIAEVASSADTYYELAGMSEQQQYAKYGQLHAQVQARKAGGQTSNQTSNSQRKTSKAPPPANHGGTSAPMKRSPYDMSDDEFMEARGL